MPFVRSGLMPDINKVFSDLNEKTIIVEGKKDVKALQLLGIENIVPINGRPLVDVVEGLIGHREIVILTDFDKQGRRLHARLMKLLQRRRIPVNRRLRLMIRKFGKARIEDFNKMEFLSDS